MGGDRREVKVDILGDATSYKKAMSEAEQHTGKTGAVMSGIFTGIGIGATQLATEGISKVVDFLGDSAKVARDAEVTTTRLTTALQDNVAGFRGTASAMEPAIDAGRRLGFTGDELRSSLSALVTVTKDTKQAQTDQSAAEDLARARGIDLASATNIVIKAQEGNVGALKKLGIIVPAVTKNVDDLKASHQKFTPEQLKAAQAADKQATATAALAAIQKSAQGQAEAYAGTMQGSLAVAGTEVEAIQERLGGTLNQIAAAVIPPLLRGLEAVGDWFGQVVASIQPLIPLAQQLGGQVLTAVGAAFDAIGARIAPFVANVVPALGDAFGVLSTDVIPALGKVIDWLTATILPPLASIFETWAETVLPALQHAFAFVQGWISDNWPLISKVIGQVAGFVKSAMDGVAAVFKAVMPVITRVAEVAFPLVGAAASALLTVLSAAFAAIGAVWQAAWDTATTVVKGIGDAFAGLQRGVAVVWDGITGIVRGAINTLIDVVNGMVRALNGIQVHIPRIGVGDVAVGPFDWNGLNLALLPHLASGTPDFGGGWAMLGERGPELAALPRGTRVLSADQTRGLVGGAQGTGGVTISTGDVVFQVQSMSASESEARTFARRMWVYLEDEARRRGHSLQPAGGST